MGFCDAVLQVEKNNALLISRSVKPLAYSAITANCFNAKPVNGMKKMPEQARGHLKNIFRQGLHCATQNPTFALHFGRKWSGDKSTGVS